MECLWLEAFKAFEVRQASCSLSMLECLWLSVSFEATTKTWPSGGPNKNTLPETPGGLCRNKKPSNNGGRLGYGRNYMARGPVDVILSGTWPEAGKDAVLNRNWLSRRPVWYAACDSVHDVHVLSASSARGTWATQRWSSAWWRRQKPPENFFGSLLFDSEEFLTFFNGFELFSTSFSNVVWVVLGFSVAWHRRAH